MGRAVNEAMRDIEAKNPQLAGVPPKTCQIFDGTLLKNLFKRVFEIHATAEGDTFGRIYEYFLGEFARTEGSRGCEFYTPISIVRGQTGHRGYARRGPAARVHAGGIQEQVCRPVRARLRDVR